MLVELLVDTAIVVMMVLATVLLHVQSNRLRAQIQETALAFAACRAQIEEVRATPFANLASLDGRRFAVPGQNGAANGLQTRPYAPDGLPGELRVVTAESAGEELYLVRAIVEWEGMTGPQQCRLETLVGERGPP